ncbi:MAG: hypothetical protein LBK56_07030 [Gracilibacteraceae bacterium]|jgi:hypothetical protein|nr:hypothetical protein [Gracilibacteraceae bacterium]
MEQTSLYIPVNIKTRFELFEGYGMAELLPTVAAALVSGFFAFVIHAAFGEAILPVLMVLVTVAASVMALAKGENNMSVVDQSKCVLRFMREQRKYPYRYTGEWGDEN